MQQLVHWHDNVLTNSAVGNYIISKCSNYSITSEKNFHLLFLKRVVKQLEFCNLKNMIIPWKDYILTGKPTKM